MSNDKVFAFLESTLVELNKQLLASKTAYIQSPIDYVLAPAYASWNPFKNIVNIIDGTIAIPLYAVKTVLGSALCIVSMPFVPSYEATQNLSDLWKEGVHGIAYSSAQILSLGFVKAQKRHDNDHDSMSGAVFNTAEMGNDFYFVKNNLSI